MGEESASQGRLGRPTFTYAEPAEAAKKNFRLKEKLVF